MGTNTSGFRIPSTCDDQATSRQSENRNVRWTANPEAATASSIQAPSHSQLSDSWERDIDLSICPLVCSRLWISNGAKRHHRPMPIATSGRHRVRGPWISRISNRYTLVSTQKDEEISIKIHDIVEAYNMLYLRLRLHAPQNIDVASAALA